jgi:hypothetical protein
MEQEFPLTPAMTDYAQSISLRKGNVTSLVIFALVLSCSLPAFLTFVMFVKHRPLGLGTAIVWVLFIGLGAGLIYVGLRYARVVSQDLAGGVYVRWTGPFTTRVVRVGRFSKGLEVQVGGHNLYGVVPLPLIPVGFNSGTVDYLPASKMLFEVRNEQGALLWSPLDTTGDSPGPVSP